MKACACVVASTILCLGSRTLAAEALFRSLTIEEAADEAGQRSLALLAERASLSLAEASLIPARLRPSPVLTGGANSLDWLGTGFNEANGAGPPEYAVRVDVPFERAHKRGL